MFGKMCLETQINLGLEGFSLLESSKVPQLKLFERIEEIQF